MPRPALRRFPRLEARLIRRGLVPRISREPAIAAHERATFILQRLERRADRAARQAGLALDVAGREAAAALHHARDLLDRRALLFIGGARSPRDLARSLRGGTRRRAGGTWLVE